MLQTERSVAVPTGMIIAALYVILLVGFSRESYMRRDAESLDSTAAALRVDDASQLVCRIGQPLCAALAAEPGGLDCAPTIDTLRLLVDASAPLTPQDLRRALRANR